MTHLEQLKAQRHAIDMEIKRILDERNIAGRAKIYLERIPTHRPDEWHIALKKSGGNENWSTIITLPDKKKAINAIPEYIHDLQVLYERLKGDNNG